MSDAKRKLEGSSDDEEPDYLTQTKKPKRNSSQYLNTINRLVLDFDFLKTCLETLVDVNVYACLVCGKFFQGRSVRSPAYLHAINADHHAYLSLRTEKFYILPDNYEIVNENLNDIVQVLNPRYKVKDIKSESVDLNGNTYIPGFIGLDNKSHNNYANVIWQLLCHIEPIRDFFINMASDQSLLDLVHANSRMISEFGLLCRKIWSSHLFKNHTSSLEILLIMLTMSKNKFAVDSQHSPKQFLMWFLNTLNLQLHKILKVKVVSDSLQGKLLITKFPIVSEEVNRQVQFKVESGEPISSKFWILQLDLPPNPIFNQDKIKEVDITELLSKYNGKKTTPVSESELRTYILQKPLPKYILLFIDRNLEQQETRGNPTVVTFPSMLDFSPYTQDSEGPLYYALSGNIEHDVIAAEKPKHLWLIDLKQNANSWYTIQNLKVNKCQRELLFTKQCYIQVWEAC